MSNTSNVDPIVAARAALRGQIAGIVQSCAPTLTSAQCTGIAIGLSTWLAASAVRTLIADQAALASDQAALAAATPSTPAATAAAAAVAADQVRIVADQTRILSISDVAMKLASDAPNLISNAGLGSILDTLKNTVPPGAVATIAQRVQALKLPS